MSPEGGSHLIWLKDKQTFQSLWGFLLFVHLFISFHCSYIGLKREGYSILKKYLKSQSQI